MYKPLSIIIELKNIRVGDCNIYFNYTTKYLM